MRSSLLLPVLIFALCGRSPAQNPPATAVKEATPLTPATPAPAAPAANAPAQPPGAPQQPQAAAKPEARQPTPEEAAAQQLAAQLMQIAILRTPAAILRAQAEEAEAPGDPEPNNEPAAEPPGEGDDEPPPSPAAGQRPGTGQRPRNSGGGAPASGPARDFHRAIMLGKWPSVGETLKKLPEPLARQVFLHVAGQLQAPLPQQRQNRQQIGKPDFQIMIPGEILQIAAAAPFELKDPEIDALAGLVRVSLQQGFPHLPLVQAMQQKDAALGGASAKGKLLGAQVLARAGLPLEAVKFLPALADATNAQDAAGMLIHAQALLAEAQRDNTDAPRFRAWETVLGVLGLPKLSKAQKRDAMQQCLALMDQVPKEARAAFFRKLIAEQQAQARAIIAAAAEREGSPGAAANGQMRAQALQLLHEMAGLLLQSAAGKSPDAWTPQLNLMALPWMDEAVLAIATNPQQQNAQPYEDPEGNIVYPSGPYAGNMASSARGRSPQQTPQFVEAEKMIEFAPDGAWMGVLDPSLAMRVRLAVPEIAIQSDADEVALKGIASLAQSDPDKATDLATRFLQKWSQKRNPMAHHMRSRYTRYFGGGTYYYSGGQQGIPITRSLQERNVADLQALLAELRKLPLKPLKGEVLATAFISMHSNAEVFRGDDIAKVFGPPERTNPEILTEIIDTMRQRLASSWRQPKTQEQAKTKRTDKEITAEVQRGYDVATELVQGALAADTDNWRYHMIHAALAFDWAEFKYGNKTDLKEYVAKREEAFSAFEKTAQLYGAQTPKLKPAEYSVDPFVFWFNANLGASDLSYVTRQQEPSEKNLDRIRKAILDLPGEAARKHMDMFVFTVGNAMRSLPPHLKHPYVSAGLRIIGDHEKAREARQLLQFYEDLMSEVEFRMAVDGDTSVGTHPFGLFVSLRYTEGIGREADGFRKFLTNQTQMPNYYNPMGTAPQDYRDQFEKQVKEKFQDGFEVLSVSFADPKEPSRGIGRPGWRETPYAYLLLKAKQPSVDQIPPLKLDLDFADQYGQVVLPRLSAAAPIDCHSPAPPVRPLRDLEVTQILDERELAKGVMTLDVKAAAKGVIPDLERLLQVQFPGFSVKESTAQPMSVSKLGSDDAGLAAQCERSWLVSLKLGESSYPSEFAFPALLVSGAKVVHKAYRDADLVDVPAVIRLTNLPVQSFAAAAKKFWWAFLLGLLAVAGAAAWFFWKLAVKRRGAVASGPRYRLPQHVTPFSIMTLLRSMKQDTSLNLTDSRRQELDAAIHDLERTYFSRDSEPAGSVLDLRGFAEHWLKTAGM